VVIWITAPSSAMTSVATSSAIQKLPVATIVITPTYAPSMNSSPCAKFTTSMMPKMRVSPDATRARIMPVTMPLTVWMMI
jgi:hypothetical protein